MQRNRVDMEYLIFNEEMEIIKEISNKHQLFLRRCQAYSYTEVTKYIQVLLGPYSDHMVGNFVLEYPEQNIEQIWCTFFLVTAHACLNILEKRWQLVLFQKLAFSQTREYLPYLQRCSYFGQRPLCRLQRTGFTSQANSIFGFNILHVLYRERGTAFFVQRCIVPWTGKTDVTFSYRYAEINDKIFISKVL